LWIADVTRKTRNQGRKKKFNFKVQWEER
jgi:hypothetical protein